MPKRIQIAPHLPVEELEKRYRQAKDGVERSHYPIILLLERCDLIRGMTNFYGWEESVS